MIIVRVVFLIFILISCLYSRDIYFSSGQQQVSLLELYSSEGCSSCPSAEDWINSFINYKGLWTHVVPIVFHVDYWNHLGWIDKFAKKEFTNRQYLHKKYNTVSFVYTPAFIHNAKEWKGWFNKQQLHLANKKAGELNASLNNNKLTVKYLPYINKNYSNYILNIAILGFNLKSHITNGENKNKKLIHNFVALTHNQYYSQNNTWNINLPKSTILSAKYALSIWITYPNSMIPLQATGGWI